jgi:hypothetical protein
MMCKTRYNGKRQIVVKTVNNLSEGSSKYYGFFFVAGRCVVIIVQKHVHIDTPAYLNRTEK